MANEKFEPQGEITDVEIRLECLRLATEFSPENDGEIHYQSQINIMIG